MELREVEEGEKFPLTPAKDSIELEQINIKGSMHVNSLQSILFYLIFHNFSSLRAQVCPIFVHLLCIILTKICKYKTLPLGISGINLNDAKLYRFISDLLPFYLTPSLKQF